MMRIRCKNIYIYYYREASTVPLNTNHSRSLEYYYGRMLGRCLMLLHIILYKECESIMITAIFFLFKESGGDPNMF